ncbi:hypothetical protein GWI33_002197 [Rhynchophorus ferrugineus]|uniref:Metallo-beta-lactamase domain-containing protein 1 n=1 Tax=Rhynchophorus ferrugineus TaxID=354439 RepID=A0A834MGH9_RHYFE|nr:hypothetical protein GWI33_002197 [Rhynchophorus ferrugineus]
MVYTSNSELTKLSANMTQKYELKVLFTGYSRLNGNVLDANCTCTLIKGPINVIIDTMTAWDGRSILNSLKENGLSPDDINFVVCTHGHSDHIGCNYLFLNAVHIVGFSISKEDKYFLSPDFSKGEEYVIHDQIKVIPTPGHTLQDVSVLFQNQGQTIAVTGDLFENERDLLDENIWISAGSDNVELQRKNRNRILGMAKFIVPGHGAMFKVPQCNG